MTDKEIIKALECCSNASWSSCHDCPYRENQFKNHCAFTLSGDALDLINRQQAEIEMLQKENNQFADIGKMYSEIRAEAIKEYIEKLKDLAYESDLYDRDERWVKAVTVEEIDETYKEMVGEDI